MRCDAGSAASTPRPGVEPLDVLASRARAAFIDLVVEHDTGPLVLVSHDAFNCALLQLIDPSLTDIEQRTGCWNQLSFVGGVWRVDAYNLKPVQEWRFELGYGPDWRMGRLEPWSAMWPEVVVVLALRWALTGDHRFRLACSTE
jgi:broad specificity phosphatase PhoE